MYIYVLKPIDLLYEFSLLSVYSYEIPKSKNMIRAVFKTAYLKSRDSTNGCNFQSSVTTAVTLYYCVIT